jgi:hypothetical protein
MEITISSLIKIILGVLVVAAVAYGLYMFFANNVFDSFKNMGINTSVKFLMSLI